MSSQGNPDSGRRPLNDTTNGKDNVRPDEHGWSAPVAYDYDRYKQPAAGPPTEGGAAEASAPTAEFGSLNINDDEALAWASNAAKYEWKDEYGDVGPRDPELEKILFENYTNARKGAEIANIKKFDVTQESTDMPKPIMHFEDAGLHPAVLSNVKLAGYDLPTPVQAYVIPAILAGRDIVACAQTGSGKTAAFLLPIISRLMGKAKKLCAPRPKPTADPFNTIPVHYRAEPLVVIVAPTRELATQIFTEASRFCYRSMLRPCVVYGGVPSREQRADLAKGCDILIATPGRLIDFMNQTHVLSLQRLKYTVIDEADEMLEDDWSEDLSKIMAGGDTNEDSDHVYMMFSATFPAGARTLAKKYMAEDHVRIRVGRAGSTHLNITQKFVYTERGMKDKALYDLLLSCPPTRTLVFVNSKGAADRLDDYLYNESFPTTSIHADRTQREREDSIRNFRSGRTPIMIATGVSARGLDIRNVMHVINYDLPSSNNGGIHEYIHRIGRTARIGNVGLATSFYDDGRDSDLAEDLVKILVESKQVVPDFLEQYKPGEGEALDFGDQSDDEEVVALTEMQNAEAEAAADAMAKTIDFGAPEETTTADAGAGWGDEAPSNGGGW